MMLANLSSAIQVASGGDIGGKNIEAPELRALLENFVSSSDEVAYATLLNSEAKGISAGRIAPDAFLQRELERAYAAARDGRVYNGQALVVERQAAAHSISGQHARECTASVFLGMIGRSGGSAISDSPPAGSQQRRTHALRRRFAGPAGGCGQAGIRDRPGHEESGDRAQFCRRRQQSAVRRATKEFAVAGRQRTAIRCSAPTARLPRSNWAVVVQKPQREAYRGVYEMQRTARLLALLAVLSEYWCQYFRGAPDDQSFGNS